MIFDEYDFEHTAEVVLKLNKSMVDLYDKEGLINFMKSMAYQYLHDKNSTCSTGGFVLSSFTGSDGERHVRASVSASLVEEYLKKMKKKLDAATDPV
jgi:hypothetical protein